MGHKNRKADGSKDEIKKKHRKSGANGVHRNLWSCKELSDLYESGKLDELLLLFKDKIKLLSFVQMILIKSLKSVRSRSVTSAIMDIIPNNSVIKLTVSCLTSLPLGKFYMKTTKFSFIPNPNVSF